MKKVLVLILALTMVFTCFVGCGNEGGNADSNEDSPVTVKVGHVCAEAHPCQTAFLNFAERCKERSGGTINVEVYPASQLGSEREMIEMTMAGSMELFYSGSQTLGLFCDAVNFQGLPFFFTGGKPAAREFFEVYGDEIAQKFNDELDVQIVWTDNSAYGQASNDVKIVLPKDLKGVKIRTLESEMMIKTYEHLGALATPVNMSELYTAMQQGTIQAATINAILLGMMNISEVTEYYLNSQMFVDMGVSMYTNEFYQSMSENQQKIFSEELAAFTVEYSQLFDEAELSVIDGLEEAGVEVTNPSAEEFDQWIEAVQPVYDWYKTTYGEKYPKLDEYIQAAADINAKYIA